VGGTVLPLLGAVDDCNSCAILVTWEFETAQETISVGVEAVAGSAIMLLTVPWGLLVFAGWVDIMDDTAQYKKKPKLSVTGAIKTTYL
jgi:hypothetical protein